MKLRNLLFGTMIACAFVACSNDDDPTPEPTPEAGTASLKIALNTKAKQLTKADIDKTITTLTVAIYDAGGNLIVSKTNDGTNVNTDVTNDEASFNELPAGTDLKLVAYANMPTGTDFSKLTSLGNAILFPAANGSLNISDDNLPMSSGAVAINLTAGVANYYGYATAEVPVGAHSLDVNPLALYRNVARIDLMSVSLDITAGKLFKEGAFAGKATFELDEVFVLNATNKSLVGNAGASPLSTSTMSVANWGDVMSSGFNYYGGRWSKLNGSAYGKVPADKTVDAYYTKVYTQAAVDQEFTKDGGNATTVITNADGTPVKSFYVFENHGASEEAIAHSTKLALRGHYTLAVKDDKGNVISTEDRAEAYYSAKVGIGNYVQGGAQPSGEFGVYRNRSYQMALTVAGNGNLDPTEEDLNASLFVRTKVVEWGQVKQNVVIE